MTDLLTPPSAPAPAEQRPSLRHISPRTRNRKLVNSVVNVLLTIAIVIACIPLLLILYVVLQRGVGAIAIEFFTSDQGPFQREGGGFRHGFFGTFYIMVIAIPLAVIMGVATSVYLVEYGKGGKLASAVRFVTDVMTGVPSIFVGLVVYATLIRGTGLGLGFGTFVAGIAIALIMLPIVVRSCEEMLKLVPDSVRNASAGLGARKWQTTTRVVLPAAAPGLATGSMLAVARGAGETAPLLLTALGSLYMVTAFQGEAQTSLPQLIYQHARQPFPPGLEKAWGGALCLVAITLIFTVIARTVGARFAARREGM
ncbi:phosphate ABC transporter permease PstA [Natronosporangium hydrolyticum]|uniref:Phosphate transport system permease protein PstA n=1 Tax=Natronosporangium hydrolyticum TaxID=2811111 RepID=A0A895YBK5_9ACTN|nr:phosphate ABC transporter permease PstA [Natronosporangium hydrolyticum]QSB15147.1 phosphate ABC transporter permease PstA [Natronosporangium hydrolyticum]